MIPWFNRSSGSSGSSSDNKNTNTTIRSKKKIEFHHQKPGYVSPYTDTVALVTGSCGLCGSRCIEMLCYRGTKIIIAFDIQEPNLILKQRFDMVQQETGATIIYCCGRIDGDITNHDAVQRAFTIVPQIHIVYHIAALVGPFFDKQLYYDVNYHGTERIIQMCQLHKVPKLVYSSSPGTRFTGANIEGLTEDELPIPKKFLAYYAETKAMGEVLVSNANNNSSLLTISVAPHQIYGPYDTLFLMKFLEVCGNNRLRIFGTGQYLISVCYVDNYCHGLMCGADQLYSNSKALGKFYIITDGNEPYNLWQLINEANMAMGFVDLNTKLHLPVWFLYIIASVANVIGYILNIKFKLNYFSLRMSTMHRYFNITNAMNDLKYTPIVPHDEAWKITIQWFREHWLPEFLEKKQSKLKQKKAKQT